MAEMRPYIVRQGDYLAKLADKMGFDADEVWSHAKNQGLKDAGRTPDMLCPGDVLHVPDEPRKPVAVALTSSNPYGAEVTTVTVKLRLVVDGKDLGGKDYETLIGGVLAHGRLPADGTLEVEVPTALREFDLRLPNEHIAFVVGVGDLDPPDTDSGKRQRLQNLGYLTRDLSGIEQAPPDEDNDPLTAALRAFAARSASSESAEPSEQGRLLADDHRC